MPEKNNNKRPSLIIIHQQIRQPRRNEKILGNTQITKTHEEMDSLNRPLTNTETESAIRNLQHRKAQGQRASPEFYQTFDKELMPTFLNPLQKNRQMNPSKLIL